MCSVNTNVKVTRRASVLVDELLKLTQKQSSKNTKKNYFSLIYITLNYENKE